MSIIPYKITTDPDDLADLRRRLSQTRWPTPIEGDGWSSGTDLGYLQDLCAYWQNEYDWSRAESALNQWPQFTTIVDGQQIHFLHVKSATGTGRPLMLLHGWPSSVFEFTKIINPLIDPAAYGGSVHEAFDVVIPSLPGYGWSGPTTSPGWDVSRIAAAMAVLMQRLGYGRYGLMGGDWGSLIGSQMATLHPDRISGLYLTMANVPPIAATEQPTELEQQIASERESYRSTEVGYIFIQATKPQSLAYALSDSPSGLAGWIVEKMRAWTDCDGNLESVLSREDILDNITSYWLTNTIGSSMRLYRESVTLAGSAGPIKRPTAVPTGVGVFPKEINRASRRQMQRLYNVVHWTEMPRGGHFPALEQPELLVADIRSFFRSGE